MQVPPLVAPLARAGGCVAVAETLERFGLRLVLFE